MLTTYFDREVMDISQGRGQYGQSQPIISWLK